MRRRPPPLIALILALLLLGAQQAAFSHMIGHVGAGVSPVAAAGHDDGHGEALALSHVCTACVSAAALSAAAPFAVPPRPTFDGVAVPPVMSVAPACGAPAPCSHLARGPPSLRS